MLGNEGKGKKAEEAKERPKQMICSWVDEKR
jgi:hypothetical protein